MSLHANTDNGQRGPNLGTIVEDSISRGRSKSPDPLLSKIEVHDFKDTSNPPERRSTHPVASHDPQIGSKSRNINAPNVVQRATFDGKSPVGQIRWEKSHPHFSFHRTRSNDSDALFKNPKRQSTINTNSSLTTDASASFEETAVWDQKALLALDGGGIRGYSALLIMKALMREIGKLETNHRDGPAKSSFHPLSPKMVTDSESIQSRDPIDASETETSPWLPCHYFDYMAGTSTGGLISIMLGRLRMNIDDCIKDYQYFGEKVFGRSRWFHIRSPLFWPRDKYNHKVLEEVIQKVVDNRVPHVASFPGGRNFGFDENRCRIVVLSYQRQRSRVPESPYIFRSYKNLHRSTTIQERVLDRNPGLAHDIPIWQVARATSAAPTYFEPQKTGDLEYLDGGMGANNPCEEIYDEVRKMNNNSDKCVRVILSIGTGKNNKAARFSGQGLTRYWNYLNWAKKWASDSQETHMRMLKTRDRIPSEERFDYFRLNVEEGLDAMKLDEWRVRGSLRTNVGKAIGTLRSGKTPSSGSKMSDNAEGDEGSAAEKKPCIPLAPESSQGSGIPDWLLAKNMTLDSIRAHTESYLAKSEVRNWLEHCAAILVENRRRRTKADPQRWEKTCFGAWYQCEVVGCQRAEKEYEDRKALKSHLKDKHSDRFKKAAGWDLAELDRTLDRCKIIVN